MFVFFDFPFGRKFLKVDENVVTSLSFGCGRGQRRQSRTGRIGPVPLYMVKSEAMVCETPFKER